MPIFEYACDSCERTFERLVGVVADEETLACPDCGSVQVRKKFSLFAALGGGRFDGGPACAPGGT